MEKLDDLFLVFKSILDEFIKRRLAHALFDEPISRFYSTATMLETKATLIENQPFESAIVKIESSSEKGLFSGLP